jgi:ribonuclease E
MSNLLRNGRLLVLAAAATPLVIKYARPLARRVGDGLRKAGETIEKAVAEEDRRDAAKATEEAKNAETVVETTVEEVAEPEPVKTEVPTRTAPRQRQAQRRDAAAPAPEAAQATATEAAPKAATKPKPRAKAKAEPKADAKPKGKGKPKATG